MNNDMGILEKLSLESEGQSGQGRNITIGNIKKLLGKKFQQEMILESDDETSELIFPTMFIIYMHPDDYHVRTPFFERWGPIILARIYTLIRKGKRRLELKHKMLERLGNRYPKVKYTPTDARWCVQFTVDGTVPKGEIKIDMSYTIPFKVEIADNAPRVVKDPDATIKTRNPRTSRLEEQNMGDIQVLGEGIRLYPFDKMLQEDPDKISELIPEKKKELALLQWENLEWPMREPYIMISGKSDPRNGSNILKINSDKVQETHVAIQHKETGFQLAAWGPTMLNERHVELSEGKAHINWVRLIPKSTIVLNNEVVIKFMAKTI